MSAEQERFNELKKLLAIKQHEQPPPDFFQKFSDRVFDRLQHPESLAKPTWWQRLCTDLDIRACAVGAVVCALLLYAMLAEIRPKPTAPIVVLVSPYGFSPQTLSPPGAILVTVPPMSAPPVRPEKIPQSTAPVLDGGQPVVSTNQFPPMTHPTGYHLWSGR